MLEHVLTSSPQRGSTFTCEPGLNTFPRAWAYYGLPWLSHSPYKITGAGRGYKSHIHAICSWSLLGILILSVLKRCVPKTLAFAFGLRLRSKTRCFKTRVLGRRLPNGSPKRLRFRDLRSKTLAFKKRIAIVFCDLSPVLPLFFGKMQGKSRKKQGFSIPTEPLKSLEKKAKTLKKTRNSLQGKKQGNQKNQGKEGQGRLPSGPGLAFRSFAFKIRGVLRLRS